MPVAHRSSVPWIAPSILGALLFAPAISAQSPQLGPAPRLVRPRSMTAPRSVAAPLAVLAKFSELHFWMLFVLTYRPARLTVD